jgi:energy-coupling factor transport system substrate-specific component
VSWELVSFLILAAVLIGGFAWYERSRPPSQVVALVAALAALAVVGRIAFAAIPNVKPTTDIVIFAGYALGPAPGFAVGALTGLVSNFWFGQGPWTPWQMAGWGMCGLLGALLALGGRNVGRLTLAATCGFAGIAYGALLNFSLMATYGGDLSWERFLALESRAVPFDVAHMAGNVVLALLAGPAMVRMLVRFRERFEWRAPAVVVSLLLGLVLVGTIPARAAASDAGRAQDWLESVQNSDGGWGASPGDPSGTAMTGWVMLGLEAAGRNPLDVSRDGQTPVDFLRARAGEIGSSGDLARTILALEGAGVSSRSFAGRDLAADLARRRRDNGSFEGWPGTTAFSIVALRTAGATGGIDSALSWLRKVQNEDGGWGDVPGSPSTSDGTGAVLQALSASSKASDLGVAYLRGVQRTGGGFPLGGSGAVNSQSTAWAIQGIVGAGSDPTSLRRGGDTPLDYLAAHQEADGHYRYSGSSDQTPVWVTGQALAAVSRQAFPVAVPSRAPQPKPAETAPPVELSPTPTTSTPPPAYVPPSSGGGSGLVPGTGSGAGISPGSSSPSEAPPPLVPPASSVPPVTAEPEEAPPVPTQTGELASAEFEPPKQSPGIPLAIGLLLTGLVVGATWWLGRRRSW